MPRTGQNPARWLPRLDGAAPVTVTMIVHIPHLEGYWAESLQTLKMSLGSLQINSGQPFDLIVLDNASCREVRTYLERLYDQRVIKQLFLSHRNLGKVGGWNVLFAAAGGETISYADSDVLFLPGWLETSLEVLEAFPRAAMVTAQPIPGDLSLHCSSTLSDSAKDSSTLVEDGDNLIPENFVESHRHSLGATHSQYAARLSKRREVRLTRGKCQAFASASHFQFTSRRQILQDLFPMPTDRPLGDDSRFDAILDEAGFWRLSTTEYLVHHLGNIVPDLSVELPWADLHWLPKLGDSGLAKLDSANSQPLARVAARPVFRRLLKLINRKSFELLYFDR